MRSLDLFDPGDGALAAAQHQPPAVQEVRGLRRPLLAVDPGVVDRHPTLADGAARGDPRGELAFGDAMARALGGRAIEREIRETPDDPDGDRRDGRGDSRDELLILLTFRPNGRVN